MEIEAPIDRAPDNNDNDNDDNNTNNNMVVQEL